MPAGYRPIPNWFAVENQGGGIAVADLSGTGQNDLIAFMVDNPDGRNQRRVPGRPQPGCQGKCHRWLDCQDGRAGLVLVRESGSRSSRRGPGQRRTARSRSFL